MKHPLLLPPMDSLAARRARQRVLVIGLCLVALSGTGVFAAIDQAYSRATSIVSCRPEEKVGTAPIETSFRKFLAPVSPEPAVISKPPGMNLAPPTLVQTAIEAGTAPAIDKTSSEAAENSKVFIRIEAEDTGLGAGRNRHDFEEPETTGGIGNNTSNLDCASPKMRSVLADVSARFGPVTVVATRQLRMANHRTESIREKLHHDCKAVDFRPNRPNEVRAIEAYLRSRDGIGGVESYRDGVVHVDIGDTVTKGRPGIKARQGRPKTQLHAASAQATMPPAINLPERDH